MTISGWLQEAEELFDRAGISSARLDAQLILSATLGQERSWLLAHQDDRIEATRLKKLTAKVERRLEREPIAYITNRVEFYGRTFYVDDRVLIPRPETEQLTEAALQHINNGQAVIDIGTGSGAIAITLALERPKANIHASDISSDAIEVAMQNATRHGASIQFFTSNLLENIPVVYDLIVANLPYVSQTWAVSPETNFEPQQALFAGKDGLALYKNLFKQLDGALRDGGQLLIEADPRQSLNLQRLATEFQLSFSRLSDYVFGFENNV